MTIRHASCSCGQLRVTAAGDPARISVCHCTECQRRTGSAFGVQARFPADNVSIEGESTEFVRSSDSGNKVHSHFCPQCGSTVWYTLEQVPGFIAVPVGMFGDSNFPTPTISIYETRKFPWLDISADIDREE